jgi:hypothetical protein
VKFSKDSLDSFLNSAMNIEFVYLILTGIIYNINLTDRKMKDSFEDFSSGTQMQKENAVSVYKYYEMKMSQTEWDVDRGSMRSSISSNIKGFAESEENGESTNLVLNDSLDDSFEISTQMDKSKKNSQTSTRSKKSTIGTENKELV